MADDDFMRRRRGRNIALLVTLLGLSALFYAIAMVKFAAQAPHAH
jgi:hypothetical protein